MSDREFSVYQFFNDPAGLYERVRHFVDAEEAVRAFHHYTNNVACKMGLVNRVIITDGGDCTVAEWKRGEGVTWPKKPTKDI
jgi:alkyl hydroperoxide reductase subunit AhpC